MAVRAYKDAKGRTRFLCEFQQKGERVLRRCPPGVGRAEAQELETTLRREIFAAVDLGKLPEISLEEAILRWLRDTLSHKKDQKKPQQNALLLAPFVAGKSLRQVTDAAREAIHSWTLSRGNTNESSASGKPSKRLSPATLNRRLCVLKAAAKHAWKQGWIEDNLSGRITLLPEHNKREVYLTSAQVRALSNSAPTAACRAAILIASYTGLRASELLALSTVTRTSTFISVPISKTGKPRNVPVISLLRPYLGELPLELSYWQLHKQFCAARAKAKMPHVRFHDLRHSTASMLVNAGVDLFTIGAILGHAGPQTTARYAHLSQQTLKRAMGKLR